MLDLSVMSLTEYAGRCNSSGNVLTGYRLSVRLNEPAAVTFDSDHTIYASISGAAKIVGIDKNTDTMYEICSTDDMFGKSMVYSTSTDSLFIILNHALAKVDISTGNFQILSGTGLGSSIGGLNTTNFAFPNTLLSLNTSSWLISDRNNNR